MNKSEHDIQNEIRVAIGAEQSATLFRANVGEAWTGTLAASILDIDFKKTVLSVTLGVALAGVIMMIASVVGLNIFN